MIPNGSDAPVELVNPYHGIYAAVTRTNRLGEPKGGWHIEEAMTREEALRSFTNWSAYAEFNEDIKGSLEVGKLADFAVIDRDLMTCPQSTSRTPKCCLPSPEVRRSTARMPLFPQ